MSEAIDDPVAFTKLTDHVLQRIQHSTDPKLKHVDNNILTHKIVCDIVMLSSLQARDILENLERRKLYKLIGQAQVTPVLSKVSLSRYKSSTAIYIVYDLWTVSV